MQLQSHLIHVEDQIQWKKQNQIICKQTIDLAISNHGTLIGLTALVIQLM